jgi:hypothetical protein
MATPFTLLDRHGTRLHLLLNREKNGRAHFENLTVLRASRLSSPLPHGLTRIRKDRSIESLAGELDEVSLTLGVIKTKRFIYGLRCCVSVQERLLCLGASRFGAVILRFIS